MQFDDKIAMLVPTFNDFSPNTIIQTANQTYKNIDVWILNDSEDVNLTNQIKKFCDEHKFYFLQHDSHHRQQHPTKIGNIFYFLEKYGNKYDYIFENDSSSIVSSSFVYNSLCFFHSPLLNHEKDACVVPNGCFYGINNLMSYLVEKTTT
jgi:membrane glycosyltransferase